MALQKSRGHTHFSQTGRKVQCHLGENSRASSLPAIQGLCRTDAHTHTCVRTHTHVRAHAHTCACAHIHTCTHMHTSPQAHTHTHTPTYTHTGGHAQSELRGWELLVSQCANCFSILSPWISQQESDVSIVQAHGGLSEAPLLGLLISILPTLSAPQTFSLSPIHSGLPRGWARAHFSAVIYGVSPYGPP